LGNNEFPRNDGVGEPGAVRTTIVGGRPPGNGAIPRHIPRGVEVLIKKAAVDPAFKKLLFEKRAEAAEAIGLKLTAAEEAMLAAVPLPQLEGIIAHTRVATKFRPAFLGYAAGAMLAVVGVGALDNALERYEPQREGNKIGTVLNRLKTYAVRYKTKGPTSGRRSAVVAGIRTDTGGLFGGTDFDDDIRRLGGSRGIRPDQPLREMAGRLTMKTERRRVRLAAPGPSSISGNGAAHPNRSPRVIHSIIRRHLAGIVNAYKLSHNKNQAFKTGKIVVAMSITPDGAIENARIVSDTINNAAFRTSLLARIRSWRFPPVDNGDVTVIYPFVFIAEKG
jgi:hypothetical protein